MPNSNTTPSALFCCLYRLFTMGIDSNLVHPKRRLASEERFGAGRQLKRLALASVFEPFLLGFGPWRTGFGLRARLMDHSDNAYIRCVGATS